ncbi:ABC transporter ATP-binding protein/permease [Parvibium lacunae]|uniref:ABC transporter ATP-binding protein/permease n=2 Tax=Parvibium lacunae TaxID=1888893 RepID=A0A368KZ94_9BURK|nr:ABC transporter ATP-binding protein/permease [Parvibium lacunae]
MRTRSSTTTHSAPLRVANTNQESLRQTNDWQVLATLLPYLWRYRGRLLWALLFLVAAKLAHIGVPLLLKQLVDAMDQTQLGTVVLVVPLGLLFAYGGLRLATTLFTELREVVFAKVTQGAVRTIALQVFAHLHTLSLRFHLSRQTGGVTRDIERGTRGISSLVSYTLYSIVPTLLEITLVVGYLLWHYDWTFALIALTALVLYIAYTIGVTEWRTHFRRTMNELDSKANVRAIDSLLNYETVKYFGNEAFELQRYDESMARWERAAIQSQYSLSLLNLGQSLIIAVAVSLMLWRATVGVAAGQMTLGDLVLVNAFMLQLYVPLNFLGVIYREIKQSLTDMDRLFRLLRENQEVADQPEAQPLSVSGGEITFANVTFAYEPNRPILRDVSFTVPTGTTTAVVGPSGAGKSTLARLLFRFYDVQQGQILIDGQDIRQVTQHSLRSAIGIVPQDTVLFNDDIGYNISYGKPGATEAEITAAAQAANIHPFIQSLPEGYRTQVGERGLKLSGGEKQRVAIARTLLKNPPILLFDEATSALDSHSEQAIQQELRRLAEQHTALVIAHRLSTIVHAEQILVMRDGQIVERGTHTHLLTKNGLYAQMWALQQQDEVVVPAVTQ